MEMNIYKNYLYDLVAIIKDKARNAKNDKEFSENKEDLSYQIGYLMAYHEIISLMKQQAEIFEIKQEEFGLDEIDPEIELL